MSLSGRQKICFLFLITVFSVALFQNLWVIDDCNMKIPLRSESINYLLDSKQLYSVLQYVRTVKTAPLMVTLVNDGYVLIALNWLCHTRHLLIHHQILVITTDHKIKQQLSQASKEINIIVLENNIVIGNQEHGHVGYIRLLLWRTQILNELIQNEIHTFLFEFDSIWFKNPLPFMLSYNNTADMLCVQNSKNPGTVNGGFFYLFPTKSTKDVVKRMLSLLNRLYKRYSYLDFSCKLPSDDNDQEMLSRLIRMRYSDISAVVLPYSAFADGIWYEMPNKNNFKPYVVHNDYIVGNTAKIQRFKTFGHWFINDDKNVTCNYSKVISLMNV